MTALLAAGGMLAGCAGGGNYAAAPVAPAELPAYELKLELRGEPTHDDDGYDVSLGFELLATDEFSYNALVQEIAQEVVYERYDGRVIRETLTLVEAFRLHRVGEDDSGRVVYRLPPFQRDRHFERGYLSVGPMIEQVQVWRVVRYYPAYVEGADWTRLGFAHLPGNRTGSLVTRIPANFNENHQQSHVISGIVRADDRQKSGWYHMKYHWWREPTGQRPQADFSFVHGSRPAEETTWLAETLDRPARSSQAGE